jgi:hypothetical protein
MASKRGTRAKKANGNILNGGKESKNKIREMKKNSKRLIGWRAPYGARLGYIISECPLFSVWNW